MKFKRPKLRCGILPPRLLQDPPRPRLPSFKHGVPGSSIQTPAWLLAASRGVLDVEMLVSAGAVEGGGGCGRRQATAGIL